MILDSITTSSLRQDGEGIVNFKNLEKKEESTESLDRSTSVGENVDRQSIPKKSKLFEILFARE
jgi:hypothetical protein